MGMSINEDVWFLWVNLKKDGIVIFSGYKNYFVIKYCSLVRNKYGEDIMGVCIFKGILIVLFCDSDILLWFFRRIIFILLMVLDRSSFGF